MDARVAGKRERESAVKGGQSADFTANTKPRIEQALESQAPDTSDPEVKLLDQPPNPPAAYPSKPDCANAGRAGSSTAARK